MIAEYSIRIEDRNFLPLFKKLEPSNEWSFIDAKHLVLAETDAHTIVRAWLNSMVRKWNKEFDAETKKQTSRAR